MGVGPHIRSLAVAVAALLCLAPPASSQPTPISIDESKIRAALQDNSTVVTIPIESSLDHPIQASLLVEWLDPSEVVTGSNRQDVSIAPGQTNLNVPLPLSKKSASIWTRLRYSLTPSRADARAFQPFAGVVALPHIAAHVFELKTSYTGVPRPGSPFTIYAEAVHPLTRNLVPQIVWTAILSIDDKKLGPMKTSSSAEGLMGFVFTIPDTPENDPDEDAKVEIRAQLGDFSQEVSSAVHVPARASAQIQSDKPIYQPGQTLHLRATTTDAQGRAAAGRKVTLRIDDQENERAHTAHLVTSRFGVVADDWHIPDSSPLGSYQIKVTADTDDDYTLASHVVRVSRYELPSFTVVAKPDRAAYLPNQPARVTITASYLFGKPVPKGKVKVVRQQPPAWNPKTRKTQSSDQTVSEGEAGPNGEFIADLNLNADHEDLKNSEQRYQDIHFAAYCTDPASGRTEQRRFDVRITREPIHVYVIHAQASSAVYISTSYADGKPASTTVEIFLPNRTISLRTNQYGIGKAIVTVPETIESVEIRATDSAGEIGTWKERYWSTRSEALVLETRRTLHRRGESVVLQISSPPDAPADQIVIVHANANDRAVASRVVRLTNHKVEVTFPDQPEFRRTVVFSAWSDSFADGEMASKAVIFPDGSDLSISVTPGRPEYKPGDRASLRMQVRSADGNPVEAALGLAVVDQAVLERARTDSEFGNRPWFACAFCRDDGETEIGGIRLNDLYHLPAASPISPALDLAAEALVANAGTFLAGESSEDFSATPLFRRLKEQMNTLGEQLEQHYASTFDYPRDLATFSRAGGRAWSLLKDPWGQPPHGRVWRDAAGPRHHNPKLGARQEVRHHRRFCRGDLSEIVLRSSAPPDRTGPEGSGGLPRHPV